MDLLNRKQRQILKDLDSVYPGSLSKEYFLRYSEDNLDDILVDIKLLKDRGLIDLIYTQDDNFPADLKINHRGKEKLQENIITRLADSAHNDPLRVITIIVAFLLLCSGILNLYFVLDNNKKNELRQIMPPTVYLTQELKNESDGELEIIPTFYFKKNSDRLFTVVFYEPNLTLNGIRTGKIGGGYPTKLRNEGISEGPVLFPSFYASTLNYYNFFHDRNVLIIDYVIEIKDMESQITYKGKVTTKVNSSSTFQNKPLKFNWSEVSNT